MLFSLIFFICSPRSSGEDVTGLLHFQLVYNHSVLLLWDEVPNNFHEVKVTVNYENNLTEYFNVNAPFSDKGLVLHDLQPHLYVILISFFVDGLEATSSLPILLSLPDQDIENGIFDIFGQFQPTENTFAYNGSFREESTENNNNMLQTNILTDAAISFLVFTQKFKKILIVTNKIVVNYGVNGTDNHQRLAHIWNLLLPSSGLESSNLVLRTDPSHNIALFKKVELSSTHGSYHAVLAVDGDKTAFFHTQEETDPFLQIDIGYSSLIRKVIIFNRNDYVTFGSRLQNFKVFVGQNTSYESNKVCIHDTGPTGNRDEIEADCTISVNGRYVHVVSFGFKALNLREVEVYGYEGLQNLALFGTATVIGNPWHNIPPEKGIDGLIFARSNFMHTNKRLNAYLRIRLRSASVIFLVVVYNRYDCCKGRLNNFHVSVGFDEDGLSNPICGRHGVVKHLYDITIICERPMFGDYAQLTLDGTNYLHVAEFEVIGYEDKIVPGNYSVSYFENPLFASFATPVANTQGYAIGFEEEPDGGFYRLCLLHFVIMEPSPFVYLGGREVALLETLKIDKICESDFDCGHGRWRLSIVYTKQNMTRKAFFYSVHPEVCIYKECPFAAPTSLVLQNISSTTMTISWDAIDTQVLVNPEGFQYYFINATNLKTLDRTSSLTTSLSQLYIEELSIGTEYQFIVAGVASGVVGNWSQPVTFKTHEEVPIGTAEHFRAETINSTSVVLKWEHVKEGLVRGTLKGYQLKIFWENQEMVVNISVVMEYMVGNLQPYTNYKFALKVMNSMYVAENLTVVNITTPMAVPAALVTYTSLTAVSPFGFNISWDHANLKQVYGPLKGYLLSLYPAENYTRNIFVGPVQSYQFLNLKPFTNYTVKIYTENDNYLSTNATVIQARTLPLSPGLPPRDLTASNTSSTSLNVSWKDILNEGWGDDYKRLGFQITLKQDNYTHQLFVLYNETFSIEIKNLSVYTKYVVQVAGVNEKGTGVSALCMTYTNEEAPVTAPSLTVAKALSPNTGFVQWKAFKTNLGNVRAYTITVSALGFARKRKRRAVLTNALNQQIFIHSNILNHTITGLNGAMDYDVKIAAQTLYLGVYSQSVTITTPVGVPLLSARNISCSLMDSTSLLVLWRESPKNLHQGPLAKYRVYYLEDESNVSKHVDVKATGPLEAQLLFLKPLIEYQINITAFTSAGEGAITTEDIICVPQGVPGSAPLKMEVKNIDKSNRALVTWNDISDWNTLALKTYHLHLIHISNGEGLPTNEPVTHTTGHVTSFVLKNLEAFSTYQVTVSACTRQGCGKKSGKVFDTCRLFSEKITFKYMPIFPFAFYDNNSQTVEGTLIEIAKQAVLYCTETCGSISPQKVYFSYEELSSNSTTPFNITTNGLRLPFIDPLTANVDATFSELYKTPSFVLLSFRKDPVGEGEVAVSKGMTDIIPLCGVLFIFSAIFGMFWCILDSTWEPGNCIALKGFFNGVYLAFITSTTVGYGDMFPTTIKGRLYIVCWTLIGLVLTSIVVGNLSSSLATSTVLSTKDASLTTEDKIIAVHGSPSYVFANRKLSNFERDKTFHFTEDVLKQLYKKKYKFALLDVFTLVLYEELFKNYDLEIKKFFPIKSSLQVGLYGDLKKYSHCITKFALTNQDIVDNSKSDILIRYKVSPSRKSNKTTSQGIPQISSLVSTLLSWESKLFQKVLFNLMIALAALLVIGSLYEGLRCWKVSNEVCSEKDLQLARYEKARTTALQLKEDMRELVFNFENNSFDTLFKHGEQLLHHINCLSKLYGVNVKYIKLSDAALSPEEMLRFKKERIKST